MITGRSVTTNLENIEHLFVVGKATAEAPYFTTTLLKEALTEEQQSVYDDGVALVTGSSFTYINNTGAELDISRVTSSIISVEEDSYDYEALSSEDQTLLLALLGLLVELKD